MPLITDDPLLQPFTLKRLTLRNRVVSTSHEPAYSEDGMPKQRYAAYHVEKAPGGVGLTMSAARPWCHRTPRPPSGTCCCTATRSSNGWRGSPTRCTPKARR